MRKDVGKQMRAHTSMRLAVILGFLGLSTWGRIAWTAMEARLISDAMLTSASCCEDDFTQDVSPFRWMNS